MYTLIIVAYLVNSSSGAFVSIKEIQGFKDETICKLEAKKAMKDLPGSLGGASRTDITATCIKIQ